MATYKVDLPIEKKRRLGDELPLQLKQWWRLKGRITEDEFEEYGHPIDTDSDGIEHPLSKAFATQHHRQRCTKMRNPCVIVIGDFTTLFSDCNPAAVVKYNLLMEQATEVC